MAGPGRPKGLRYTSMPCGLRQETTKIETTKKREKVFHGVVSWFRDAADAEFSRGGAACRSAARGTIVHARRSERSRRDAARRLRALRLGDRGARGCRGHDRGRWRL